MIYTDVKTTPIITYLNREKSTVSVVEYTPSGPDPDAERALDKYDAGHLKLHGAKDTERFAGHCTACLSRHPAESTSTSGPDHYLLLANGRVIHVTEIDAARDWAQEHADRCSALPNEPRRDAD